MNIGDAMVALHDALVAADIPHAFGGTLALAWCTPMARGTIDIDVNVLAPPKQATNVLAALPPAITWSDHDAARIRHDGQVRLRWDATALDLFFSTSPFHDDIATRVRWEPFRGQELPFIDCADLAVFKAYYDRARDWVDLEDMHAAGTLDLDAVIAVLVRYLRPDDERIDRLRSLGR
ncbi:MAG: hypothetical protein HYU28_12645 [Actinobacteria bacterium]|nr:hypothetical protein [Actinomycetota bacterium]